MTGPGIDYTLDPYIGCEHSCRYCYVFRKQFVDDAVHGKELWGDFVDVKVNAPAVLESEIKNLKPGMVLISALTDPYQPSEFNYRITRRCLEILLRRQFKITILTKSNLLARDLDIILKFNSADVGLTITTDDDKVREIIEPNAPSIDDRVNTLRTFHSRKVRTYVHIGPILPMNTQEFVGKIHEHIDYAIIDKMNYITPELEDLYHRNGFGYALDEDYFKSKEGELRKYLERENIRIW